jgi:hypothetical protein
MNRYVKYGGGVAVALGLLFGMTRQPVIEASPEPLKTGLQKIRLDMERIAAGQGWQSKKKPGSGGGSDDQTLPILRSNGVPN